MAASTRRATKAAPALTRLLCSCLALALLWAPAARAGYRQDITFNAGNAVQGMAIDPSDGEVFVAGGNAIAVYSSQGVTQRVFGVGPLNAPLAVGVSPVAPFDVYVADTGNNQVVRFTNSGSLVSSFGAGQLTAPRAIAFSQSGDVFVGQAQTVAHFTADGTFQGTVAGGLAQFQQLGGLASSSDRLFGTDSQANAARSFDLTGSAGTPYEPGALANPGGIAVRAVGNLATIYVADRGHNRVAVFGGGGPLVGSFGRFTALGPVAYSATAQRVYVADGATISTWQEVPDPALGKAMDIQVDTGVVLFKPKGSKRFKRLSKVSLVKNGTIIDARRGTVSITSVLPNGTLQSADFFKGIFKATQKRSGLTNARLVGGNFAACPAPRASKKQKPVRQLWASGSGRFKTQGRYLSAAIRGTAWQTIDTCSGSTVKVTEGAVTVRDLLNAKTVVVRAGGFYSVTAPHH